jgi:DNA-directed RNA polymerase subunit RPC12/RpoP
MKKKKPITPTRWLDVSATGAFNPRNTDFRCAHCHHHVSADVLVAGVYNRNHCPYCLWSRHMDWRKPGDRLSACKAPMRPIGLTVKPSRNAYAANGMGELMLIHRCDDCGKLSINRIAADDDGETLLDVFEDSFALDSGLRARLAEQNIRCLQEEQHAAVLARLFGAGQDFPSYVGENRLSKQETCLAG